MLHAQASPSDAAQPNFQAQKALIAARFTGMDLAVTVHAEGQLPAGIAQLPAFVPAGAAAVENDAESKVVGGRVTQSNAVLRYIAGADATQVCRATVGGEEGMNYARSRPGVHLASLSQSNPPPPLHTSDTLGHTALSPTQS